MRVLIHFMTRPLNLKVITGYQHFVHNFEHNKPRFEFIALLNVT